MSILFFDFSKNKFYSVRFTQFIHKVSRGTFDFRNFRNIEEVVSLSYVDGVSEVIVSDSISDYFIARGMIV